MRVVSKWEINFKAHEPLIKSNMVFLSSDDLYLEVCMDYLIELYPSIAQLNTINLYAELGGKDPRMYIDMSASFVDGRWKVDRRDPYEEAKAAEANIMQEILSVDPKLEKILSVMNEDSTDGSRPISPDQTPALDYKALQKRIESGHVFLHNIVNGVTNEECECKNQMQPCRFTGAPWMMRFDEEDGKWWEMGKIVGYNEDGILISAVFSTTEGATHIIKWEDIKWINQ